MGSRGEMRVGAPAPNQNLRELDHRNARYPSWGGEDTSPPGTKREPSSPSPPRDQRPGTIEKRGEVKTQTPVGKASRIHTGKESLRQGNKHAAVLKEKPYGASPGEATERERSSWEGKTGWQRNELLRPWPAAPKKPRNGKTREESLGAGRRPRRGKRARMNPRGCLGRAWA